MKIKVCGMKHIDNISSVGELPIDYMGFIFYEKSPRFAADVIIPKLRDTICKTGVFVNSSLDYITSMVEKHGLGAVQLHGNETPDFCLTLRERGLVVIKAFGIGQKEDMEATKMYDGTCNYYLFDTKTKDYGGSGKKFDHQLINEYRGNTLFFLSGGIGCDDAEELRKMRHGKLYGIDVNSCFEIEPGLKNRELLTKFITDLSIEKDEQNQ